MQNEGFSPYVFRCWGCGAPVIQARYTSQPMCPDLRECRQRAQRKDK